MASRVPITIKLFMAKKAVGGSGARSSAIAADFAANAEGTSVTTCGTSPAARISVL